MNAHHSPQPAIGATPAPGKGGEAAEEIGCSVDPKSAHHALALAQSKDEPRIDSRVLAYSLGVKPKATMNQMLKYREALERFNQVTFKKTVGERKQGGENAERIALLTEDQAFFVLALSRNNARVIDLKVKLVQAFSTARRSAHLRQAEYLPEHHAMNDRVAELARGSANQQHIHANFSRLVNRAAGIEAGQRNRAPMATLATVCIVATRAMVGATDHRDGYRLAKAALQELQRLLPLSMLNNTRLTA